MLVTQFDKFVNRSTKEILGDEIVQENLQPMLSTDIVRNGSNVTGVKGEKEVYYRTGNVNLTSADVGALDEDNVYNGLDQTDSGYALDARQGKTLNDAIDNKLDKANVYNGLDKTVEGYALDARQGKVLVDKLAAKSKRETLTFDANGYGYTSLSRSNTILFLACDTTDWYSSFRIFGNDASSLWVVICTELKNKTHTVALYYFDV